MKSQVKYRKIKLIEKDLTEKEIAHLLGVSIQAVNYEVMGGGASERIRQEICKMTDTTPEEFWPEVYGEKDDEAAANS